LYPSLRGEGGKSLLKLDYVRRERKGSCPLPRRRGRKERNLNDQMVKVPRKSEHYWSVRKEE